MAQYYVNQNAQENGDHEVHRGGCNYMPLPANRIVLGDHWNCRAALAVARLSFTRVDGCYYCCPECHTS